MRRDGSHAPYMARGEHNRRACEGWRFPYERHSWHTGASAQLRWRTEGALECLFAPPLLDLVPIMWQLTKDALPIPWLGVSLRWSDGRIPEPKNFVPFERDKFRLPSYQVATVGNWFW